MKINGKDLHEMNYILTRYSKAIAGGEPITMWMHEFRTNLENRIFRNFGLDALAEFIHPMWGDNAYDLDALVEIKMRNEN